MSKIPEKKLGQYVSMLENLLIKIMDNNEQKSYETESKLEVLKNLLAKRGVTPEEIESVLARDEPIDINLENLSDDLINEYIPPDINSYNIPQQKEIINFIEQRHIQLKQLGINLNEEQNQK